MNKAVGDSTETRRLLGRIHEEDRAAYDRLFARHRAYLREIIAIRLDDRIRQRVDPSDVVQETHFEASRRMDEYLDRRPMPFRVWLRKMAHERLRKVREQHVNVARRTVTREVPLPYRSSLHFAQRLLGTGTTPSEQLAHKELVRRVREAVAQLEEIDQEIVLMLNVEGLSSKQVGYVLELDPVTIRRHHARALLQINRTLRSGGISESQL